MNHIFLPFLSIEQENLTLLVARQGKEREKPKHSLPGAS